MSLLAYIILLLPFIMGLSPPLYEIGKVPLQKDYGLTTLMVIPMRVVGLFLLTHDAREMVKKFTYNSFFNPQL